MDPPRFIPKKRKLEAPLDQPNDMHYYYQRWGINPICLTQRCLNQALPDRWNVASGSGALQTSNPPTPTTVVPPVTERGWESLPMVRQRPKDERRETFLSCAADAVKLNKKEKVTLMRWLALILQFQDHNRLARKLADEQGEIDQFKTLMDTFAPRGNFHEGMVNILFKFREWSKLTQFEENPFKERAIYEYLCFANKKKSAGTFADRFLGAIKFFMAKGEFYESAQVTNSERIRSQARLCGDRKKTAEKPIL